MPDWNIRDIEDRFMRILIKTFSSKLRSAKLLSERDYLGATMISTLYQQDHTFRGLRVLRCALCLLSLCSDDQYRDASAAWRAKRGNVFYGWNDSLWWAAVNLRYEFNNRSFLALERDAVVRIRTLKACMPQFVCTDAIELVFGYSDCPSRAACFGEWIRTRKGANIWLGVCEKMVRAEYSQSNFRRIGHFWPPAGRLMVQRD
jgi:hypothetical protein